MPSWLAEDPSVVYLLLGVAALVLAAGWWFRRERKLLIGLGVVALLAGLVWLIHVFVITDGAKMVSSVKDMAAAVAAKDTHRIFEHVSDDFQLSGLRKADFRGLVEHYVGTGQVREILVWDFETRDVSRELRTGKVIFMVKAKGPAVMEEIPNRCEAQFVLDKDDQWRMKTFRLFPPQADPATSQPLEVPWSRGRAPAP